MKYSIIETGSKGNAVVFNDVVMVDCGVAFKKLVPFYKNLQLVLLTHIHSDHFCRSTIKRLAAERPNLRWGCPRWLVADLVTCGVSRRNIDVMYFKSMHAYRFVTVEPFELSHDVENCGYKIEMERETVVYATDTCTLPDLPNCDYYFVEANYKNVDELADRVNAKIEKGEYVYEDRLQERHMSEEYATDWLVRNGKPDSEHVFLHEHSKKEEIQ